MESLYGAIDDGAIAVRIPKHAKKELEAYLDCGLLCCGFARLRCERCEESRLVVFSCKGRGFCPSCLGRRMCATAANLIEDVLPEVAHRPWVLTFPFPWRRRLAGERAPAAPWRHALVTAVTPVTPRCRGRATPGRGAAPRGPPAPSPGSPVAPPERGAGSAGERRMRARRSSGTALAMGARRPRAARQPTHPLQRRQGEA
ncbi:transposase zinc-binding domain-containing protein [Sorangium sp. Soce836]